jgi:hypothetical protein
MVANTNAGASTGDSIESRITNELKNATPGSEITPSDELSDLIHHDLDPSAGIWITQLNETEYTNDDPNARIYDVGVDGRVISVWEDAAYTVYQVHETKDAEYELYECISLHLDDVPRDGPHHQWQFEFRGELGRIVADRLNDRLTQINNEALNA